MTSTLLQTITRSACVVLMSVALTGCMTASSKTASSKADDKCTDDCCKEDGKAVVQNKPKDTMGKPATQPVLSPATQPAN
jgi:hypothetical protein